MDILVTCDDGDDGDAGGDVDDCVLMTMAMMAILFEHIQLRFLTPFE